MLDRITMGYDTLHQLLKWICVVMRLWHQPRSYVTFTVRALLSSMPITMLYYEPAKPK